MRLSEIFATIFKYISDENKSIFINATVDEIYVDDDGVHVCFRDGNTDDWIIPIPSELI